MGNVEGKSLGKVSGVKLDALKPSSSSQTKARKALLFVAEGTNVNADELDIEFVAVDAAAYEAMALRRS